MSGCGQMMIIMQGAPGSGKSTLAQKIQHGTMLCQIYSTDDFWRQNAVREYRFDR